MRAYAVALASLLGLCDDLPAPFFFSTSCPGYATSNVAFVSGFNI